MEIDLDQWERDVIAAPADLVVVHKADLLSLCAQARGMSAPAFGRHMQIVGAVAASTAGASH